MRCSPVHSGARIVAAWLCGCAALAGCATFSRDGGFDAVSAAAGDRLGLEVRWPRSAEEHAKSDARVAALLAHPLSPEDAVQIALLNNHALQASFQELGVSEADLVQSGRLQNPRFTLRRSSAAGLYDVEEALTFNILSLVTAPYVHSVERLRFSRVQDTLIVQVVQLADRTRTAYFTALAARDSLHYAWQVKNAAQTGAELARRMLSAGNWNRLDQARQQGFYLQALQQLAQAQLADESARAELGRLLGIPAGGTAVNLAERLPDLPHSVVEPPDPAADVLQNRVDLRIRRTEMDELARRLKLTRATRFVNVFEAGPARVHNGPDRDPFETGFVLSLEIPIFDSGNPRVRKSESLYAQAAERFAQAALDARAEILKAAARYRAAFDMAARERDEIMPMRKAVADQDLLRYNASLISVFDLLIDARERIAGVNDYIERVRDFWIAKSHLDAALIADSAP